MLKLFPNVKGWFSPCPLYDSNIFFKYIRISPERFEHFLGFVENSIRKEDKNFSKAVSPGERLGVTFRFLASGESQQSLSFAYLTGKPILSRIIRGTYETRFEALAGEYLHPPSSTEEWKNVARDFQETLVVYGSKNDGGVLANSSIGQKIEAREMNITPPRHLDGCLFYLLPYYLLGD